MHVICHAKTQSLLFRYALPILSYFIDSTYISGRHSLTSADFWGYAGQIRSYFMKLNSGYVASSKVDSKYRCVACIYIK